MKKKSKRQLLKCALNRKVIVMHQIQLCHDSLDYLEKLHSEMLAKEDEGVEYSQEEWDCLEKKCGWEDRLLDSLETEVETVETMINKATGEK